MEKGKKIIIVAPLDFTSYLCNKYLVRYLVGLPEIEHVYVCGEITLKTDYVKVIESWGALFHQIETPRHISVLKDLKYLSKLKRLFIGLDVDVVINMTTKPNVYGPIAARAAGVKYVFTGVWGRGTAFTNDKSVKRFIIRFFLKKLLRNGFNKSDLTWITNPEDYKYLISEGIVDKTRAYLTKNYVDTDVFCRRSIDRLKVTALKKALNITEGQFVVTLVGRMIWPKGIQEFVNASKILATANPKVRFLLIGAEEKSSPDKVPTSLLKEWSRQSNFDWLGYQEDILSIYGVTNLAVLPSFYKEGGYPRALTEPMALELPVITSDSKDCREPVVHGFNGYRVPIKDSEELAKRISEIANDINLCEEFGKNSRKRVVEEYSEEIIMQNVVNTFSQYWR